MSKVGDALKRKLGPLPFWAWALIGGAALYWYRLRGGSNSGSVTVAGGSPVGTPSTPQTPVTLQPGESAYDPNTGALVTSPGGGAGGSGDPSGAIDALAGAIADAISASQGTANNGEPLNTLPQMVKKNSPTGKKVGSITKRTAKPKPANTPAHTPSIANRRNFRPARGRSTTSIRNPLGGRTTAKSKPALNADGGTSRKVSPTVSAGTRTRSRSRFPLVQHASAAQHPVATHPRAVSRPAVPAPRPSAPPTRTQRTPAAKPAPKQAKKR